jgi:replicative DNA helicase
VIGDIVQSTLDSIELRSQKPQAFFRQTGWREFDEQIGGLRGGNLITIAARPGKGKSAAALDILLHNAAQGVPCLLFSFEMTMMEIVERSLSKGSGIDGMDIGTGKMRGPQWVAVTDTAVRLTKLPLWLIDKRMTAERFCAITRRWWATVCGGQKGHGLVCRDYLGLTKSSGREETRAAEVAEMTGSAKELATDLDIPFVDVAQLNRDSEKENRFPRLSDLRESGSIEQDSNTVIFVQTPDGPVIAPPEWWKGDLPPEGQLPAAMIVAKNRGGRTGLVPMAWEPKCVRFRDRPLYAREPVQEALL